MKKRVISVLAALSMLASGMVPVMAEDSITVGGELLYSQDFERDVEEEMLNNIYGTGEDAATFTVVNDDGDKALLIEGNGKYGYNYFGAEYKDAVVKMDFKQTAANGSNGAWLGLGVRAVKTGKAYYSNAGGYFDVIRYDAKTKSYNKDAEQLRDRFGIVTAKGARYSNITSFDAFSNKATGKLNTNQIFSDGALKVQERNTKETLRMQNTISETTVTSELKTLDGQLVEKLSAKVTPFGEKGFSQLLVHGGEYIVDDIKVMAPAKVSSVLVNVAEATVMLGSETDFVLSAGDITLQPDVARYEYDKTAVNIDTAKGTIAPLKLGTHTVKVYLDDVNSDKYLESSFTITGVKALEAVVENPNPAFGEGTKINVYYGGKDVTENAVISGPDYADGMITPASTGLTEVTVSYNGQTVIVPIAVNNTEETIGEQETTPVFTEDFEGNATELTATYNNGSDKISVTSVTNATDNTTDNALCINAGATTTAVFGPADLKDYIVEYDSFCKKASGSTSSFYGITMRSNSNNGGYKVGITPVMKYNEITNKVDSTIEKGNFNRRVTVAYSDNSANSSKWFYSGFSETGMNSETTQGDNAKWIHHKNIISGDKIKSEIKYRTPQNTLPSYETSISDLNSIAKLDGYASGGTTLATHSNVVYFDNIKIYRVNSYNDISVAVKDGKISVTGTDNAALSGTVSTKTYGAVDVDGTYITEGNGVGYVAVTYEDEWGNKKNKVVNTGAVTNPDAEEFTVISSATLYDGTGAILSSLEKDAPVFAKATLKRGALDGNGVMMAVCFYDNDTDALEVVYIDTVDAVQRIGENIELYTKFILPEGAEDMYVNVLLWDSNITPLTEKYFEITKR